MTQPSCFQKFPTLLFPRGGQWGSDTWYHLTWNWPTTVETVFRQDTFHTAILLLCRQSWTQIINSPLFHFCLVFFWCCPERGSSTLVGCCCTSLVPLLGLHSSSVYYIVCSSRLFQEWYHNRSWSKGKFHLQGWEIQQVPACRGSLQSCRLDDAPNESMHVLCLLSP